jgi:diadenosine tetraphosphatase ApaH/serine/threonine PP2A family protein phosphatase
MKYLIISDIHANLEALEATLAAAGRHDRVLMLGDVVGYGADPNAVVERVRALPDMTIVRGNHDKVGAGLEDVENFNLVARRAIAWTAGVLTPGNRAWLAELPRGPAIIDDHVEICHGAPFDEDVYIFDDLDALRALHTARRSLCLFGHTHVPAVFQLRQRRSAAPAASSGAGSDLELRPPAKDQTVTIALDPGFRYLINCGAVGQPRDSDPRAAYGMFDSATQTITLMRTDYDVSTAQTKILAAGLPEVLAQRLAVGR